VDAEVDVGAGLPTFAIVGLPDLAVQEARERVRSAVRAAGFDVPNARIVVNLAPGPVRKHGTGFDLAIAVGLLTATRQLPSTLAAECATVGELSLDGSVRAVPGMLAHALAARRDNRPLLGPADAPAAFELEGLDYRPVSHLSQLRGGLPGARPQARLREPAAASDVDFDEVAGHELAKRALLIAAAGGHNVLMIGPPGSGKTMLARRLPTILPPLDSSERLESALVHSVAGLDETPALSGLRPFRAPHHAASIAGLVGGGSPPRPGKHRSLTTACSSSTRCPSSAPPLSKRSGNLSKTASSRSCARGTPALPGALRPRRRCEPVPVRLQGRPRPGPARARPGHRPLLGRIGGPLMDRIDLVVDVARLDPKLLLGSSHARIGHHASRGHGGT